ncbi:DUF58 domain-containing protein [Paenibacillus sp. KN14-4R]|uniref:DUF58 domain-containing protein n=1 Tax=Paenibacillus sp. KN14-4R TaxID=3445773 RepID=UPI003FA15574
MERRVVNRTFNDKKLPKSFWYLCAFFLFTLFFLLFQGGKLAVMLFIFSLVFCIYVYLGRWSGIRQAIGSRTFLNTHGNIQLEAGQSLESQIVMYIPGYWPIPYVRVKESLVRRNGEGVMQEGTFVPDWARRGVVNFSSPPLRRGIYSFDRTELTTVDVFGIFEHKGEIQLPYSIIVFPKTAELGYWTQFQQLMKGIEHHTVSTLAHRETTQINGVREYNYGDRLSRIHWNATAKTGTWKSKEFERESLPITVVVLDRWQKSYSSSEEFELAVSVTASLLKYGSHNQLPFGLLTTGGNGTLFHSKVKSDHFKEMTQHLVEVEPDGWQSMEESLQQYAKEWKRGTLFVFVSPRKNQEMLTYMKHLEAQGMHGCHILIDLKPVSSKTTIQSEEWVHQLRKSGILGYSISSLEALPTALGGAKLHV